jgi:tyrosyl-tRNA synthetase
MKFEPSTLSKELFERFFQDWSKLSIQDFLSYIQTKIDQEIGLNELEKRIATKGQLYIKFGIDPTGPDVHMGHLLPIMLLRQFQRAGHKVQFIIGNFTARIGDPSGRNDQRPALTDKDIANNLRTYLDQVGPYLNMKKVKVHKNAKWLSKMDFSDILNDLLQLPLSEFLQRQDFRARLDAGHGLSVGELLYSYAQGIDSVQTKADVEVGGRDQLLNFSHARTIMKELYHMEPEIALTTPVLEGTSGDGRKMSKSYGNYIGLSESSTQVFGKVMSIPDSLVVSYFVAFADITQEEISLLEQCVAQDPLETKKQLGQFLVAIKEGSLDAGAQVRREFESTFSKKSYEDASLPSLQAEEGDTYQQLLVRVDVTQSKSELSRLFEQGAIKMVDPEERAVSPDEVVREGVLRVGKKKYFRIISG